MVVVDATVAINLVAAIDDGAVDSLLMRVRESKNRKTKQQRQGTNGDGGDLSLARGSYHYLGHGPNTNISI